MSLILVGPSHIPRIRHALECVGLPKPAEQILYLGDGGFPIWNKDLYDKCCAEFKPGDSILLIAGDFRFGNSVLTDDNCDLTKTCFFNGHTHVKRELCSIENDKLMKNLCLRALAKWKSRFGESIVILHWTLAMRTVKNRLSKLHTDIHGKYEHPTWNIDESVFSQEIPGLESLQSTSELSTCNKLVIDNDLHPSTLGYLYIIANAAFADHNKSLGAAKSIYMAGINSFTAALSNHSLPKCLFAGPSKCLTTILATLPAATQTSLSRLGFDFQKPNALLDLDTIKQYDKIIYLSDEKIPDQGSLKRLASEKPAPFSGMNCQVQVLYWDALATQVMQWRARNQRSAPTGMIERNLAYEIFSLYWNIDKDDFRFEAVDRHVEFGAGGTVTLWGVLETLRTAAGFKDSAIVEKALAAMHAEANRQNLCLP